VDPGEAIFQRLLRLWRRVRPGKGAELPGGAATLAELRERLRTLATLLSGEAVEVHGADDEVGGVMGVHLLLPRHMHVSPTPEGNLQAYLARVAFSCASRELGFALPPALTGEPAATVATLLSVPPTRGHVRAHLPGAARWLVELEPLAMGARRSAAGQGMEPWLEAWTRALLGDAEALASAPSEVRALIEQAIAEPPDGPAALAARTTEMVAALRVHAAGRRGAVPPGVALWGRLLPALEHAADDAFPASAAADVPDAGERRVVQLERTLHLQRQVHARREDRPLYHVFEKVETAEEYGGESGTPDAEGDVRQMEDALSELSLGTVIRTTDDPRNLVRADVLVEPTGLEVGEGASAVGARVFRYPEWDFKKGHYREEHCTVVEQRLVADGTAATHAAAARRLLHGQQRHVEALRLHVHRALYRRRVRNRQLDGPEIDVEAIVERHADLCAGRTPPEHLYLSPRKALREIAILVLVDTSFSTDAWVEGRRVLDVEMQSLLILAEAFEGHLEEEVAVATFSSHTRHDVRFGVLKGFEDRWGALRQVAPALVPGGYTRIGAALRHATAVLEATRARHKLLLMVTDGKPTDFDRYEGRHGVEDVSRAVREAAQRRIRVYGLAVEKEAKLHLARMLGPGSYRILPRPALLPDAMAEVFTGMLAA
jgi:Mg-chelatase subunit ChlD